MHAAIRRRREISEARTHHVRRLKKQLLQLNINFLKVYMVLCDLHPPQQ
jgi:hypothetical protein